MLFQSGDKVYINPCKYSYFACERLISSNSALIQDHPVVDAHQNFLFVWSFPVYNYKCSTLWDLKGYCGTIFEIHRPFDETPIASVKITGTIASDTSTTNFLDIALLCAGKYELWMVSKTRMGRFINIIKPFFVNNPSCTCTQVTALNFTCSIP